LWWKLNEVYPDRGIEGWINRAVDAKKAHATHGVGLSDRVIRATWPTPGKTDDTAEAVFGHLQEVIVAIRTVRSDYKVNPRHSVDVTIVAPACGAEQLQAHREVIEALATCKLVKIVETLDTPPANAAKAQAGPCEVYLEGLVDPSAEKERIAKRRDELTKSIAALKGRLGNAGYIAKAPPNLVKQTQDQLAAAEAELASLA
jgi:valyl-tRNA synthetase